MKILSFIASMLLAVFTHAATNQMSIPNHTILSGDTLLLPVSLNNESKISAFQCDLFLPTGITLALNEEEDLDVSLNPARVTSSHSITARTQSDGSIRLAAYSTQSKLFKGNEGELFYLNLITDAEVEGEMTIALKNIICSTAAAEEIPVEDTDALITMAKYIPKNDFILADTALLGGTSILFPVVMNNESELSAFQCDLYLPEGITLELNEDEDFDITLNHERATSSHTVSARVQEDGSIRVAAYSSQSKKFNGNEGVLFFLYLNANKKHFGTQQLEIKNIICSTVDAKTVTINDADCQLTVLRPVEALTLGQTTKEVIKGESFTLIATATPEEADNKTVVWKSSDETVATVVDGVVTTLKVGETTITATTTDGTNLTATCTVTVKPVLVASLTLDQTTKEVIKGESFTLIATATPEEADNKTVVWKSSDETVATVVDGVVTTLKVGEAVITASTTDGTNLTATCTVTVKPVFVASLTLDQTTKEVTKGESFTLAVTATPEEADNKTVVWNSSDETVATVVDGVVTTLKVGETTITATTTDGTNLTATCTVTVKPVLVASLTLDQTTKEVIKGESFTLIATATPEEADNKTVVWSSSDETVATVVDGVVTTLKVGEATITATTTDGTNLTATCTVTVKPVLVASLTLDQTTKEVIKGESFTLAVTATPEEADNKTVVWSSSDETVATVVDGVVTTLKVGESTITASTTDGTNLTATCTVTVKPVLVASLILDQTTKEVIKGESFTLAVTTTPEEADNKTVVWKSSDETVATVVDGVVITHKVGEATITASTTDGTNLTATCTVTVKPVLLTHITLNLNEAILEVGETIQLTATIGPDEADNKEIVWTSSDASIVTVDNTGLVTYVKEGTATITATAADGSGITATCTVTTKPDGINTAVTDNVASTIYYSVVGEASLTPHKGINIIKRTYTNGRVEISKRIIK